jgi:hypothetical protein
MRSDKLRLPLSAAAVYGIDRMDDVLGLQPARFGQDRLTRRAPPDPGADFIELSHNGWPCRVMDGAIHPAAPG